MKKKIILLTAILALAISLCACGNDAANDITGNPAASPVVTNTPGAGTMDDGIVDDRDGMIEDEPIDDSIVSGNDGNGTKIGTGSDAVTGNSAMSSAKPSASASPSSSPKAK